MKNIFETNSLDAGVKERPSLIISDFCYESYHMDTEIALDDLFCTINENHIASMHTYRISNMMEIITEGFGDFIKSASDFIKKIIDKIVSFFKKVWSYITSFIGDFNKFITKHNDTLTRCNPQFTISGYKYTLDKLDINYKYMDDMISEFNSDLNRISNITFAELVEKRKSTMSPANLSKIRAGIIGQSGMIEASNLSEKVKKLLRNGKDFEENIDVDKSLLTEIVSNYKDASNNLKELKGRKDKIILFLSSAQSFFDKGASVHYDNNVKHITGQNMATNKDVVGNDVTTEYNIYTLKNINALYNYKLAYIKILSSAYNTVLNEECIALKAMIKQSRVIIRKSIFSKEGE